MTEYISEIPLEKRMSETVVLKTHIINYSKTRDIYAAYRKSGCTKNISQNMRVISSYINHQR